MAHSLVYVFLLALWTLSQAQTSNPDQIIEIFSEGARSPLTNYDSSWSDLGMLTPLGLRQHYVLGKLLSDKYANILQTAYDSNQIYFLSSNYPRSIQSAGAHFYGMYLGNGPALPPNYPNEEAVPPYVDANASQIADSLPNSESLPYNSDSVAINVADQTNLYIFTGDQPINCPNMTNWNTENINDAVAHKTFLSLFQDTFVNLNQILPQDLEMEASDDLFDFADAMISNIYDNRTLPSGLSDPALITNITWAYTWLFYRFTQGQQIQREISAFNLVDAFLDQLASFRQGEAYNIAAFFSGHDTNVFALLSAFGIINEQCIIENFQSVLENGTLVHPHCHLVSFASNIIVEFYNDTNAPYVKLYYNNVALPICQGKYECPYNEFVNFARSSVGYNTQDTYFEKCGVSSVVYARMMQNKLISIQADKEASASRSLTVLISSNVSLVVVSLLLISKIIWDKKRHNKEVKIMQATNKLREEQLNQKISQINIL